LADLYQAAGYFADAKNIDHPYIFDNNGGVFLVITIPVATGGAQATGINDRGSISGFYIDSAGKNHGFLLTKGTFFTLDFPAATSTQAFGLNNEDDVVGAYVDAKDSLTDSSSTMDSSSRSMIRKGSAPPQSTASITVDNLSDFSWTPPGTRMDL
jgi:hypothetical protein